MSATDTEADCPADFEAAASAICGISLPKRSATRFVKVLNSMSDKNPSNCSGSGSRISKSSMVKSNGVLQSN